MKKTSQHLYVLLTACLIMCSGSAFSDVLKLQDALKMKKISCSIRGNGSSTHYHEPVILEISNLSDAPVTISIGIGDAFIPADSNQQNIVVTQHEILALNPGEKKSARIKGMCTEPNDASGNDQSTYTFRAIQEDKEKQLKQLAAFIEEKKYQSSAAQYAVWSLVRNDDINSIYSSDSTEERELKQFMAKLTGKTFVVKSKDYRYNYYAPPKEKTGGNFEYSFSRTQDIQIAMFDQNGILVRELFNQKKVPPGEHRFSFEFDSSVYTDEVYYFKLIVGNEILVNRKWDVQAMRDSFKQKLENRQ